MTNRPEDRPEGALHGNTDVIQRENDLQQLELDSANSSQEIVEYARKIAYEAVGHGETDRVGFLRGLALVDEGQLIALIVGYLTKYDQEKTKALQQIIASEAERRVALQLEVDRLRKLIERDQTGLAAGLARIIQILKSWSWLPDADNWGCYELHERTEEALRGEIGRCFGAIDEVADRSLQQSGKNVTEAFYGTTWTHDLSKDESALKQCVERLRRTDGVHADCAVVVWEQCQALVNRIDWLEKQLG